jgi:ApaG protein
VNEGTEGVQLLRRNWVISDALGRIEEVRGDGVVGKQPHIKPGRVHDYTSVCPLETPFGTMHGAYEFVRDDGTEFKAEIAEFSLIATPFLS